MCVVLRDLLYCWSPFLGSWSEACNLQPGLWHFLIPFTWAHLSSPEAPLSQVLISCHTPEVGLCSLRSWALTSSEVSLCIPGSSSSWILKGSTSRGSFCGDTCFPLLRSLPQEEDEEDEGFIWWGGWGRGGMKVRFPWTPKALFSILHLPVLSVQ